MTRRPAARIRPGCSQRCASPGRDHWQQIVAANNAQPPMTLRVDLSRITRDGYLAQLLRARHGGTRVPWSPSALVLEQPVAVSAAAGIRAGRGVGAGCRRAAGLRAAGRAAPASGYWMPARRPGGKTGALLEAGGGCNRADRGGHRCGAAAARRREPRAPAAARRDWSPRICADEPELVGWPAPSTASCSMRPVRPPASSAAIPTSSCCGGAADIAGAGRRPSAACWSAACAAASRAAGCCIRPARCCRRRTSAWSRPCWPACAGAQVLAAAGRTCALPPQALSRAIGHAVAAGRMRRRPMASIMLV